MLDLSPINKKHPRHLFDKEFGIICERKTNPISLSINYCTCCMAITICDQFCFKEIINTSGLWYQCLFRCNLFCNSLICILGNYLQTKDNYLNCLEKRQYLGVLFNLGLIILL